MNLRSISKLKRIVLLVLLCGFITQVSASTEFTTHIPWYRPSSLLSWVRRPLQAAWSMAIRHPKISLLVGGLVTACTIAATYYAVKHSSHVSIFNNWLHSAAKNGSGSSAQQPHQAPPPIQPRPQQHKNPETKEERIAQAKAYKLGMPRCAISLFSEISGLITSLRTQSSQPPQNTNQCIQELKAALESYVQNIMHGQPDKKTLNIAEDDFEITQQERVTWFNLTPKSSQPTPHQQTSTAAQQPNPAQPAPQPFQWIDPKSPGWFNWWRQACNTYLPVIDGVKDHIASQKTIPCLIPFQELAKTLTQHNDLMTQELEKEFGTTHRQQLDNLIKGALTPFVQKDANMHNADVIEYNCGDLHGDIHALNAFIANLIQEEKVLDGSSLTLQPNVRLVFHGDYVDCAQYGIETLFLLALLKFKNPQQVFLVRGNHEDNFMNTKQNAQYYTLQQELQAKYGTQYTANLLQLLDQMYARMPVAVCIGQQNAQGILQDSWHSHGLFEIGYDPSEFLKDSQRKYDFIPETLLRTNALANSFANQTTYDSHDQLFEQAKNGMIAACQQLHWHNYKYFDRLNNILFCYGDIDLTPEQRLAAQNEKQDAPTTTSYNFATAYDIDPNQNFNRYNAYGPTIFHGNFMCLNKKTATALGGEKHEACDWTSAHQHNGHTQNQNKKIKEFAIFKKMIDGNGCAIIDDYEQGKKCRIVKLWASPNNKLFNHSKKPVDPSDPTSVRTWKFLTVAKTVMKQGYENWEHSVVQVTSDTSTAL